MAVLKQEVKTFNVHYLCDGCGKGEMIPTGIVLTSHPPIYPHVCNSCGYDANFAHKFPYTETEVIA